MNKILILLLILMFPVMGYAQSLIVLKSGQRIENCSITREDSVNIYYELTIRGRILNNQVKKENVLEYYNLSDQDHPIATIPYVSEIKSFGTGMGYDFGGLIGVNLTLFPWNRLGLVGSLGYNLAGIGYNFGIKYRLGIKKTKPYIIALYGTNAVLLVQDANYLNNTFNGPTVGLGTDFAAFGKKKSCYFSCSVLVPFRSKKVDEYLNYLQTQYTLGYEYKLLPVSISAGFHFIIH